MLRPSLLTLLLLASPWISSAQPLDYDEAVDGEFGVVVGEGWTVTLTVDAGTNLVSGVIGFYGGDDGADIDPFNLIVPEGHRIDSIHFEYATTILKNPGSASYNLYLDGTDAPSAPFERVSVTEIPSDSRELYTDFVPLGPGQYALGRPGSSRSSDMIFEVAYTWTLLASELDVPEPTTAWMLVPLGLALGATRARASRSQRPR